MLRAKWLRGIVALVMAFYSVYPLPGTAFAGNAVSELAITKNQVPVQVFLNKEAVPQSPSEKSSKDEDTTSHFLADDHSLQPSTDESTLITAVGGSPKRSGTSDITPPSISLVTTSNISATSATINWSTNEKSTSQIQYGLTVNYGNTTALNTNLVTSHLQGLTGLTGGSLYHYRILSKDAAGNLAVSRDFTFSTLTTVIDTTPPLVSAIASSNITSSGVTLSWTTNEVSTTQVEYGSGVDSYGNPLYGSSTVLNTSLVTSHSQALQNLSPLTTYHYRVKSKDAAGNLTVSQDYTVTTSGILLTDAALASLVQMEMMDGLLDRTDMLSIFHQIESNGVVSANEFADLQTIQNYSTLYPELGYVRSLANNVIFGTPANATYQGTTLGNLAAGSSANQLTMLVNKWFLGMDNPLSSYGYQKASGSLFVNGLNYADIKQGYLGDCYFLASLAETALRDSSAISNMFIDNGDGTFTVKFYQNGAADYVTVDRQLPVDSKGNFVFANFGASAGDPNAELWTVLAEKAYVEMNAKWGTRQNDYASIASGYIGNALSNITGLATTLGNALSFTSAVASWTAGALMGFASLSAPLLSSVVSNHAYAVVDYNSTLQKFTLFNPWGISYGLLTLSWSDIKASFAYYDKTTGQALIQAGTIFYEFVLKNEEKRKHPMALSQQKVNHPSPSSSQVDDGYQIIGNIKVENSYDEPLSFQTALNLTRLKRKAPRTRMQMLWPVSAFEETDPTLLLT